MGTSKQKMKRGNNGKGRSIWHMVSVAGLTLESGAIAAERALDPDYRAVLRSRPDHVLTITEAVHHITPPELEIVFKRRQHWLGRFLTSDMLAEPEIPGLKKRNYYSVEKIHDHVRQRPWLNACLALTICLQDVLPQIILERRPSGQRISLETDEGLDSFVAELDFLQKAEPEALHACVAALETGAGNDLADAIRNMSYQQLQALARLFIWREPDLRKQGASQQKAEAEPVPPRSFQMSMPQIKWGKRWSLAAVVCCMLFTAMMARVGMTNFIDVMEAKGTATAMAMIYTPNNDHALHEAAFVTLKGSDFAATERLARQLMESNDLAYVARGYYYLGVAENKRGYPESAIDHFEHAISAYHLAGNDKGIYRVSIEVANAYRIMGAPQNALDELNALEPPDEKHSFDYWRVLGAVLFDLERYQESIEAAKMRLGSTSELVHADVYSHLGLCFLFIGDIAKVHYNTHRSVDIMNRKPVPTIMVHNQLNNYGLSLFSGYGSPELAANLRQWAQKQKSNQVLYLLTRIEEHFSD